MRHIANFNLQQLWQAPKQLSTFRAPSATVVVGTVSVVTIAYATAARLVRLRVHRRRRLMYQLLQLLYLCLFAAGVFELTVND